MYIDLVLGCFKKIPDKIDISFDGFTRRQGLLQTGKEIDDLKNVQPTHTACYYEWVLPVSIIISIT